MNRHRLIIKLYSVVLIGLSGWAGVFFLEMRAEYNLLKQTEANLRRQLADERIRLAEQEKILYRLKNDRNYVEKALRKLTYASAGPWCVAGRPLSPRDSTFWFQTRSQEQGRAPDRELPGSIREKSGDFRSALAKFLGHCCSPHAEPHFHVFFLP